MTAGRPAPDVLDLMRERFRTLPDRTAVTVGEQSLTYRQLDLEASMLADRLAAVGVAPGRLVLIHRRQGVRTVVGMLAALRLGAAWCVLEPERPAAMVRALLRDSGCAVLVYDDGDPATPPAAVRELTAGCGQPVTVVAESGPAPAPAVSPDAGRSDAVVPPTAPAYAVTTSGTTGEPKAVLVSRGALAHLVASRAEGPAATTFTASRLSWDAPLLMLFHTLCGGGTAVLPDERALPDPEAAAALIRRHRVEVAVSPPSFHVLVLPHLAGADAHLRQWIVGGEALSAAQAERHRAVLPGTRLVNEYGATETTVTVLAQPVASAPLDPVPIGRSTPGNRIHLLDERLAPVGPGRTGELYVAGPQVAEGYAGRPAETALRFLPDPFATTPGARMYRTGDLASADPTGALVFRGRADGQLKVRGVRVEREAVEAALERHPAVRQAAVLAVTGPDGTTALAACWLPADPAAPAPDTAELLAHCTALLGGQARPERFVRVAGFPLAPSGKTDLQVLRALLAEDHGETGDPGETGGPDGLGGRDEPAEADGAPRLVTRYWTEVLGHGDFGPDDDFFAVGGNSHRIVELHLRLEGRWPGAVRVGRLFDLRTVAEQAAAVAPEPVAPEPVAPEPANPEPVAPAAGAPTGGARPDAAYEV
ncbi:non-ribosomal peptide synthetase [Kitasatospora sp. NPDC088160]|uniref:non-ribosomal peptide synthetase n=1 Tax=Kitasatospora sp. NPDC088160 TaxID=3364072 RepID=UPI003811F0B4